MAETAQSLVEIVSRVATGDRAAFESLYRLTSGKLFGVVIRILGNRSSANDILQEVYVKIWQRAGDFDAAKASPITWMASIARNRAIDELRRAKPNDGVELTEATDIAADVDHPLDTRAHSEALRALLRCLDTLPADRRDMILLAYCRGLSRDALAQRFDKPVPTIKTWLHRGLAQLKTCLSS